MITKFIYIHADTFDQIIVMYYRRDSYKDTEERGTHTSYSAVKTNAVPITAFPLSFGTGEKFYDCVLTRSRRSVR